MTDRTKYFKEYAEKNREKLNEKFICDICGGKYKYVNKANHNQTKKHQICLSIKKLEKENYDMKNIICKFDVKKL